MAAARGAMAMPADAHLHACLRYVELNPVRARLVALYQRRNYGPDRVARNILKAVERNRPVAPVAAPALVTALEDLSRGEEIDVIVDHIPTWLEQHQLPPTAYGVIVTRKVGPFDLRREYAAPDS